jgi:sensor histidine kinase YesM
LRRLRERLKHLYGTRAQLDIVSAVGEGVRVTLALPRATAAPGATRHARTPDDD